LNTTFPATWRSRGSNFDWPIEQEFHCYNRVAMPYLHVVSTTPGAGKTAVAVALASGFAATGSMVQIFRAVGDAGAAADARTFAAVDGVQAADEPITAGTLQAPHAGTIAIIEHESGDIAADGPAVLVVRGAPTAEDVAAAASLAGRLVGTIATVVQPGDVENIARTLTNDGLRPLALLPEDRILAAPGVAEIRDALGAETLAASDEDDSIEDVVIAPIYTDPARPHFGRFGRTAIFTPSYKTDLMLAAIESGTVCLVITGGHQPSHYVIDRVQHQPTNILLAPQPTTVAAINALGNAWTKSRFRGAEKIERMQALLGARIDFASLARRLG